MDRDNPSVEEAPFRPYNRPKTIYKSLETYSGHTPSSVSEINDQFRRHVKSQSTKES